MSTVSTLAPITMVNGFVCRDCTDVDYAKKHIDPAHPKDGPYGVNSANDPGSTFNPAGGITSPIQTATDAASGGAGPLGGRGAVLNTVA